MRRDTCRLATDERRHPLRTGRTARIVLAGLATGAVVGAGVGTAIARPVAPPLVYAPPAVPVR